MISGNQIRIIVALFQGNFVEDQIIHINENFSGRLRKHLHAVLGDSIQNKLNGAFPKMKFRSVKYFIIFRKNLLMIERNDRSVKDGVDYPKCCGITVFCQKRGNNDIGINDGLILHCRVFLSARAAAISALISSGVISGTSAA